MSLGLPEPIVAEQTDESMWKETYTYGAGGERVSMTYRHTLDANNGWEPTPGVRPDNATVVGPNTLYYLTDALGSTIGLLATDGKVSARYHYDEFGIPTDAKKFDPNWPGPDNLFGYTGLGYDYTSGLTYARARYYQPELGRFISEDTYKGSCGNPQSQNLYGYVENNPMLWIDPSGHFKQGDEYLPNQAFIDVAKYTEDWLNADELMKTCSGINCAYLKKAKNEAEYFANGVREKYALETLYNKWWVEGDQVYRNVDKETQEKLKYLAFHNTIHQEGFDWFVNGLIVGMTAVELVFVVADAKVFLPIRGQSAKIGDAKKLISDYVGKDAQLIKNKSGDTVLLSKDGKRRVRFDINNPAPHKNPHGHV